MANKVDLSVLVRNLREQTSTTQKQFAQQLGVSFATVNRWENGRSKPSRLAQKYLKEMLKDLGPIGADLLKKYFGTEL